MKNIKILGKGCPNCLKLEELSKSAANELGIEYTMEKVTDINKIMEFGVMTTPALVVDSIVKVAGRIPTMEELKEMIG